ncbi:site-specific integrase [Parafrankia elaeagni]|uniref:site-specific integrase n=1 Tax=Parafrankia elaeagni TaxID=222534 RepID=UPI00037E8B60|nr:tyrosine-type recombinase/integrase [Parafrankia elaeagni]
MSTGGRQGSVRRDASGKWFFVVDITAPGGPRRQARRRGFATKKAAQAALTEFLGKLAAGAYVEPSRLTVQEYLDTRWLLVAEGELRPSTLASYRRNLRLHVLPRIGAVRLQLLDTATLQALYAELLRGGRVDHARGSGLSPRTVLYIHTIIRSALKTAVEWDLIPRNPADRTKPPRKKAQADRHTKIQTWTNAELRSFLEATRDEPMYALWLLLATTGVRRGEALGLAWSAVDLDAGRISIRRTLVDVTNSATGRVPVFSDPKTARGSRVIALDAATTAALHELRETKAKELALLDKEPEADLVFTHWDGRAMHPERMSRAFLRRVKRLGLPMIRLHDLRHTWATLALASNVHPKIVSERLGHASITITLEIYSHVMPGMHADAAELVAGLILGTGEDTGDGPADGDDAAVTNP